MQLTSWDTKAVCREQGRVMLLLHNKVITGIACLPLAQHRYIHLGSFLHYLHYYNKTIIPSCQEQLYYTRTEPTSWEPRKTESNIDEKMPWISVQVTGIVTLLYSLPSYFNYFRSHGMYFQFFCKKEHSILWRCFSCTTVLALQSDWKHSCPHQHVSQVLLLDDYSIWL